MKWIAPILYIGKLSHRKAKVELVNSNAGF